MLFQVFFAVGFHVLGASMDGGGNFDDDYDTSHDSYVYIDYWAVCYISSFRSSVGDLHPPSYDYWIYRSKISDDDDSGRFYISVIWVLFIFQILLFLVFFLNYLIAIVSDSYANLVESEELAIIRGRDDLNNDHFMRTVDKVQEDLDIVVFSTVIGENQDSDW
jgi:hypothetical protein